MMNPSHAELGVTEEMCIHAHAATARNPVQLHALGAALALSAGSYEAELGQRHASARWPLM